MMPLILRRTMRAAFALLIFFEAANYYRVFDFKIVYTWIGLLITSAAIWAILEACAIVMRKFWHTELPSAAWILAFIAVLIDAFGDFFHLYGKFLWYDQAAHILGSAATVFLIFIAYQAVAGAHEWKHPQHLSLIIAVSLSLTLGTFYEIEEYLEDFFNMTNRLGDGRDTANDLLMNFFGAFLAASLIAMKKYAAKKIRGGDTARASAQNARRI